MHFGYPGWLGPDVTFTIYFLLLLGTVWFVPQDHKVPTLLFFIGLILTTLLVLLIDRLPNPHP
jgi:hypothetical protein